MGERHYGGISMPKCLIDTEIANQIKTNLGIGEAIISRFSDTQVYEDAIGGVTYTDEMANYGSFEELETLLKQKGVPFDRYSSSSYDYPAEKVYFRPNTENCEVSLSLDSDGDPYIPVPELKPLLLLPENQIKKELLKILNTFAPEVTPLAKFVTLDTSSVDDKGGC
ncbi:hypothetical protein J7E73_10445 [Paenibacillus albidus]|uniref:hypothetical protein n=1 Tax=Paenibacillus albidus TaxID=2041023 RepID=UPI001BED1559|nr:hypothetical protein [Paenibacillus albidus]MBT2289545.1 hypothetical protein [Paenibacillus albidus]